MHSVHVPLLVAVVAVGPQENRPLVRHFVPESAAVVDSAVSATTRSELPGWLAGQGLAAVLAVEAEQQEVAAK